MKNQLKLFISYSHKDENHIKDFITHIKPLKDKSLIENWYDRKIEAGQNFQNTIDNNLSDADIICLFISADFLASNACMKEKNDALDLYKKKGIRVIPIILSPCAWKEYDEIKSLLSIPTDGKSITEFTDRNIAWSDVFDWLKKSILTEIKVKNLSISENFQIFLNDAELFSKAHFNKTKVYLDDLFIYPNVDLFDDSRNFERVESSKIIIENFVNFPNILIAGEDQSGKTTICKKLFLELKKQNYVPVYINDGKNKYLGNIENKIEKALKEQYLNFEFEEIDKYRIVPIIDDFHCAKHKDNDIEKLQKYKWHILIVDDIFSLNIKEESNISFYTHFKIKKLPPSIRYELIKKWVLLTDKIDNNKINYIEIDRNVELVNSTLGKILGNGIMPAYPFFILTIISSSDIFDKPLDKNITSQGYYYQSLIYLFLRKQGVKNEDFDTYVNFLTEFSFFFFNLKKNEITVKDFNVFINDYLETYNLPIKQDDLIKNLSNSQILNVDSFNNYCFSYDCIYYFFVGKYFAEHIETKKSDIDKIIGNLHINENAYISIFISHHSNSNYLLDEILLNSMSLFDKYTPACLSKSQTSFFDEKLEKIIKLTLPSSNLTPESQRKNQLRKADIDEEKKELNNENTINDEFSIDLRRSIKTVEVMGRIIKNRAGSMNKEKLSEIFREGMNVHLRILGSFFDLIKTENNQNEIIKFISNKLNEIIKNKKNEIDNRELEKIAMTIFWNTNYSVAYGYLNKIIYSLGANNLSAIIENVCDKINTPASFIVKQGINMWYSKNLQIDNIHSRINQDDFSETAKRIMENVIINHCSIHHINYQDMQRVEQKFKIPKKIILKLEAKNK